jgi:uncharacterized SAM-binding protein YcdF (DUF218 family)
VQALAVSAWELTNATAQIVLPPGGLIVLGLVGVALARSHRRTGWAICLAALLSLYLLSLPVISRSLVRTLEVPFSDPVAYRGAGAIVVLGGGSYPRAPEYGVDTVGRDSLERLRYAAHLQRRTGKPILVSGGNPAGLTTNEGEQMAAALRDFGTQATWLEGASNNTYESAYLTRAALQQAGIDTVYLVTNAWHMPRAKMAFERAGLRVIPAPMGFRTEGRGLLDLLPNTSALRDAFTYFHETAGMVWYRLRSARERW